MRLALALPLLVLFACDSENPARVADATAPVDAAPPDADPMDAAPPMDEGVQPDAAPDAAVVVDASPDAAPDAAIAIDAAPDAAIEVDAAPPPVGRLVLNEINCHGTDWVEVVALDHPVDTATWSISDERAERGRRLPAGELAPGEPLLLDMLAFGIRCDERIYLWDAEGVISDETAPDEARQGTTWGRLPDADGAWQLTAPTPGAPNAPAPPIEVVINEVGCAGGDFIEVLNVGEGPADLSDWTVTDDPNDRDRGFALGVVVEPGAFALARRDAPEQTGFTFGIGCEDTVSLVDPAGQVVDTYALAEQPRAYTWGRLPDGEGEFVRTWPTPGEANRVEIPEDSLFQPDRLIEIRLTLPPEAIEQLGREPREYVDGTVQIEDDPPVAAGIRLKGRLGSFRDLSRKSAFKVRVNHIPGQRVRGLKKLTLNNMVQDRSMLHEWLVYTIFRGMGITSPRTGYARVYLNDELYGLYLNLESLDDVMLDRWFPTTESMYEGAYGTDLFNDHLNRFEQDEGNPEDRSALQRLIERINTVPAAEFYEQSQDIIDWEWVLTTMVIEIYSGHWDGYAPTRNNYYFHFDAAGVARLLPWGTDQTFGRHLAWRGGRGRLLETCRASEACMRAFDLTLVRLVEFIDELDPVPAVRAHADRMIPWFIEHPRRLYSPAQVADAVQRTIDFLNRRRNDVGPEIECALAEDPDPDGDGFGCATDCRPDDPLSFPGAEEICGDGIDQDCNGQADDGLGCPDCTELFRGGRRYLACTTRRPYADARAHCQYYDADLAVLDDPREAAWLFGAAQTVRNQDWWIGLDDIAEEGTFTWVDGTPLSLDNWAPREPNNAGGREDCAHFWGRNGLWNDLPCDAQVGVLCEDPCEPGDADGDGFDRCGADCNDDDPTIFPGAEDLCLDGIDQDCDGAVDEAEGCIDCRPIERGPHSYLACVTRRNWDDARADCQSIGYDLAVLDSASEVADIRVAAAPFGGNFFIGLNDREVEGTFVWVDGVESGDDTPWLPNEPNDFRTGEDCTTFILERGGFNDAICAGQLPFLCEAVCPPGQDEDGDGIPRCGGDCDDSDPMVGFCVEPPAPAP